MISVLGLTCTVKKLGCLGMPQSQFDICPEIYSRCRDMFRLLLGLDKEPYVLLHLHSLLYPGFPGQFGCLVWLHLIYELPALKIQM